MAEQVNHLGQPIGFPLPEWTARPRPPRTAMEGRYCTVEPVDPARHAAELHTAYLLDQEGRNWTYLPYGPFPRLEDYRAWLERACLVDDPLVHAIIERRSGRAVGVASLMRIDPGGAKANCSPVWTLASAEGRSGLSPSARTSSAVSTVRTPGAARGLSVRMRSIRACACGERNTTA